MQITEVITGTNSFHSVGRDILHCPLPLPPVSDCIQYRQARRSWQWSCVQSRPNIRPMRA